MSLEVSDFNCTVMSVCFLVNGPYLLQSHMSHVHCTASESQVWVGAYLDPSKQYTSFDIKLRGGRIWLLGNTMDTYLGQNRILLASYCGNPVPIMTNQTVLGVRSLSPL